MLARTFVIVPSHPLREIYLVAYPEWAWTLDNMRCDANIHCVKRGEFSWHEFGVAVLAPPHTIDKPRHISKCIGPRLVEDIYLKLFSSNLWRPLNTPAINAMRTIVVGPLFIPKARILPGVDESFTR